VFRSFHPRTPGLWFVLALALVFSGCATVPGGPTGPAMRLAVVMSDLYVTAMLERLFSPGDPRDTAEYLVKRQGEQGMARVQQMLAGRYSEAFSEAELGELVAFFDTTLGRKVQTTYSSVLYGSLAEQGRAAEVQRRMGKRLAASFKATFSVAELTQVNRFYAGSLGKKWRTKGTEIERDLFADEDNRVLRQVAQMECVVSALTGEVRRARAEGSNPELGVAAILGSRTALVDGARDACECAIKKLVGRLDVKGLWRLSPTRRAKERAQIFSGGSCPSPTGVQTSGQRAGQGSGEPVAVGIPMD
jgi:hypothetical protein